MLGFCMLHEKMSPCYITEDVTIICSFLDALRCK
uniref:Uncharacterized protein n=1 Tax=Arundo donax TaxID=35708 RepID=A0A0A9DMQ2_ARUDO